MSRVNRGKNCFSSQSLTVVDNFRFICVSIFGIYNYRGEKLLFWMLSVAVIMHPLPYIPTYHDAGYTWGFERNLLYTCKAFPRCGDFGKCAKFHTLCTVTQSVQHHARLNAYTQAPIVRWQRKPRVKERNQAKGI